jgi:hypothetical protein
LYIDLFVRRRDFGEVQRRVIGDCTAANARDQTSHVKHRNTYGGDQDSCTDGENDDASTNDSETSKTIREASGEEGTNDPSNDKSASYSQEL